MFINNKNIMNKKTLEEWEKHLRQEKNEKYIKNREKLSKRFWKKNLFKLFEEWKGFLEEKEKNVNDRFNLSFVSKILNPLKETSWMDYIKKETYSSLMSIFSKFIYFLREYQKKHKENLDIDLWKAEYIQTEIKNNVLGLLRKDQEEYFSIDQEWNILPPKIVNQFVDDEEKDLNLNNKKELKKTKKNDNWQLKFDF